MSAAWSDLVVIRLKFTMTYPLVGIGSKSLVDLESHRSVSNEGTQLMIPGICICKCRFSPPTFPRISVLESIALEGLRIIN